LLCKGLSPKVQIKGLSPKVQKKGKRQIKGNRAKHRGFAYLLKATEQRKGKSINRRFA